MTCSTGFNFPFAAGESGLRIIASRCVGMGRFHASQCLFFCFYIHELGYGFCIIYNWLGFKDILGSDDYIFPQFISSDLASFPCPLCFLLGSKPMCFRPMLHDFLSFSCSAFVSLQDTFWTTPDIPCPLSLEFSLVCCCFTSFIIFSNHLVPC